MFSGEYFTKLPIEHRENIALIHRMNQDKPESEFLDRLNRYVKKVTGIKPRKKDSPIKVLLDYCNNS